MLVCILRVAFTKALHPNVGSDAVLRLTTVQPLARPPPLLGNHLLENLVPKDCLCRGKETNAIELHERQLHLPGGSPTYTQQQSPCAKCHWGDSISRMMSNEASRNCFTESGHTGFNAPGWCLLWHLLPYVPRLKRRKQKNNKSLVLYRHSTF